MATSDAVRTRLRPSRDMLERWLDVPVEGKSLLASIEAILRKYLYFRDDRVYLLLSLWTVGTYAYSVFRHYGYFHMYSSESQCGKKLVAGAYPATRVRGDPTAQCTDATRNQ
jgi:hypothetical protein